MGPNGAATRKHVQKQRDEAERKVIEMVEKAFSGGELGELWVGSERWERRGVGEGEEGGKEGLKVVVGGKEVRGFRIGGWVRARRLSDDN